MKDIIQEILEKKKLNDIYLIAHYYQRAEVQDVADFVGDSYAMALAARNSRSEIILVAGVDFMAETAAILCPGRTVLSPEPSATCPMANSITAEQIVRYKEEHPDSIIVSYVNTPAAVKAVSDVCCTSSNADRIIRQLPPDKEILFIPDQNLAANVAKKVGRNLDVFPSCCPIHDPVDIEDIKELKKRFPQAQVLVHPECKPAVLELADYVGSTAGILDYVIKSKAMDFIIGTECGIFHPILKACPDKNLILASENLICPNMKSITLEKILNSITEKQTVITVPAEIREKAALALEKMISLAS
ncbi:MAG: quinolinate synthase NadA [Syntrophomonadaceae bacterium]|nr:quinolinate synthase NadA [Syntrophomonadaceae bacterium]